MKLKFDMEATEKIVTVKHDCNSGKIGGPEYTFIVPDEFDLEAGDLVRVMTRKGERVGMCTTDSVEVPLEILNVIERVSVGEGKTFTGTVIGRYEYIPHDWDEEFEEVDEDLERKLMEEIRK